MTEAIEIPEYRAPGGITGCPACGGTVSAQIGERATSFDEASRERVFRQPTYAIRCCAGCGFYFKSHTLPLEDLDEYYAHLECNTYEPGDTFPTEQHLRRWLDRLPNGSRILDFGCSTGRTLKGLSGRMSCFGVEVNELAAAVARSRGIQSVSEQELHTRESRDFDAILLADVYEHLPRPVEVVAMLAGLLKPGGWLAIVTGNADAIGSRSRLGECWYFRSVGHLQMASEGHLRWLAARLSLRVEELHQCSHYTTPMNERLRQLVQSFAYNQFRDAPQGAAAALLRAVPRLRRAEHWPTAPALTYTKDHVVAVFRRPADHER